jgi:hypothetical protein
MRNAKAVPISCHDVVIIKHPLVLVSPACNWGQGPVLESILPLMGFRQCYLERDPLRFGCNKLRRVGDSHGPEEIRCPQRESKFRRPEPIKNKKGKEENLRWNSKSNTEWALGGWDLPEEPGLGSPFEDLSLKDWWTRVWIRAKTPTVWKRKERVLNGFGLETLSIYG